jgi:hypothetical protein
LEEYKELQKIKRIAQTETGPLITSSSGGNLFHVFGHERNQRSIQLKEHHGNHTNYQKTKKKVKIQEKIVGNTKAKKL